MKRLFPLSLLVALVLFPNSSVLAQIIPVNPELSGQDIAEAIIAATQCQEEESGLVENVLIQVTTNWQQNRSKSHISGFIKSINSTRFVLERGEEEILVNIGDSTKFLAYENDTKLEISLSDLAIGDFVSVVGLTNEDRQGLAKFVVKNSTGAKRKEAIMGTIIRVEDNQFTLVPKIGGGDGGIAILHVNPSRGYSNWKISLTPSTKVYDASRNTVTKDSIQKCMHAEVEGYTDSQGVKFEMEAIKVNLF